MNCSSPCQCSRGTCDPIQGDCVLSKSNIRHSPWHWARDCNFLPGESARRLRCSPVLSGTSAGMSLGLGSHRTLLDPTHVLHTGFKDHGTLAAAILVPLLLVLLCVTCCCCCGSNPADAADRYLFLFCTLQCKLPPLMSRDICVCCTGPRRTMMWWPG